MSRARAMVGVFATAVLALVVTTARADEVETARQLFIQGSKDFDLGHYDKAIEEYSAAYDAKPDPALLYNIAQAHKLAGHPEQAIRFYETFLSRVPDAPNADEVLAKIAELQKAVDQQQKARTMPPDQVKPLDSASSPNAPAAPAVQTVAAANSPGRRRAEKVAGISMAAVGVAVLVTGGALTAVAMHDADQLTTIDRQGGTFDPSQDKSGRAFGTAGPVLIGIGAAFIAGGGVLTVLGLRKSDRAHRQAAGTAFRF